jgi:hypothetical protein
MRFFLRQPSPFLLFFLLFFLSSASFFFFFVLHYCASMVSTEEGSADAFYGFWYLAGTRLKGGRYPGREYRVTSTISRRGCRRVVARGYEGGLRRGVGDWLGLGVGCSGEVGAMYIIMSFWRNNA